MIITVNGESREFAAELSLSEVLRHLGYEQRSLAVAINRNVVPRSHYDTTVVWAQDEIEIVAPMAGG